MVTRVAYMLCSLGSARNGPFETRSCERPRADNALDEQREEQGNDRHPVCRAKAADGRGDPDQRRARRGREANGEDSGDETGSAMTISRIDARAIAVVTFSHRGFLNFKMTRSVLPRILGSNTSRL